MSGFIDSDFIDSGFIDSGFIDLSHYIVEMRKEKSQNIKLMTKEYSRWRFEM